MGAEIADLYTVLRAETAPFARGLGEAAAKGESFTQRMGGLGGVMTKVGKATTMAGLGIAAISVKMAGDFQASMQKLVTTAGESQGNLKRVSDGVKSIAVQTGTGTKELADGMYMVESAGFHGAAGLNVLRAAAQGARAEQAPLPEVTNAVTSALKSYHLPASAAVQITNQMIAAVGHGKMTFGEFAGSLSTVLPIAASAHLSFAQVGGAIATLTNHGTSAREATQELAFTIRSLQAPNNVAVQEMQRLGLSSNDVSTKLGQRGLTGTIDMLQKAVLSHMGPAGTVLLKAFNTSKQAAADANTMISQMPKSIQALATSYSKGAISMGDWRKTLKGLPADQANLLSQYAGLINKSHGFNSQLKNGGPAAETYNSAMKKVMGGATGLNTALMLGGENAHDFNKNVAAVGKAAQHSGKDVEGWAQTQKTFNVQMGQLKERVATTAITIGTKLIPIVSAAVGFFTKHKTAAEALATVIGVVLTASVVKFATSAVTGAVKGVADIGKGVGEAGNAIKAFATSEKLAAVATKIWEGIQAAFNLVMDANPIVLVVIAIVALVAGIIYAYNHCARFRAIVQAAFAGVKAAALMLWHGMQAAWNGIVTGVTWLWHQIVGIWNAVVSVTTTVWNAIAGFFRKWWPLLLVIFAAPIAVLVSIWNHFHNQITSIATTVWNAIASFFKGVWSGIQAAAGVIWAGIQIAVIDPMKALWSELKSLWSTISGWLKTAWGLIESFAGGVWSGIKAAIVSPLTAAWHAISGTMTNIGDAIMNGLKTVLGWVKSFVGGFVSVGKDIVMGIIHGVENAGGALFDSLKNLAGGALNAAKSFLGINSPSKLFADHVGLGIAEGIAKGVDDHAGLAHASVRGLATGMIGQAQDAFGIASPSKVFRSLGIYLNEGLVDGLTGSAARVKSATKRIETLLMETYNRVSDLKGTKGVSNRWVASHEATLRHLESYARREDNLMRSLATKRDNVATKIKAAQKALAAVQKQWNAEVKTVADGVMQGFSIVTQAPQEGFALSAADVVNNMRDQFQKATQFAAELQTLQKKGLSSTLIQQIASAGVDQGGATAAALAGATKGQIAQINGLQSATQSAANGVGAAVADSMYGAGLKSAQGLVKGLQSQEKAIERQMMRIAESMKKAIKSALGIRSPSTVFAEIGTWIPKGLAKGVDDGARHATTAVGRLAGSVAGAGSYAGAGLAAAGSGGGTVVNQVYITVEGHVLTERKLRDVVQEQMLRLGMRNPQSYPAYKR